jgi:hypothetical protein
MTDYIYDKESGRCVAYIRDGEVFTDEQVARKIGTVSGTAIYNLNGEIVGYLDGLNVTGHSGQSLPKEFLKLLKRD